MTAESGWERRRFETANRLRRVALDLFAARGYRSVTMDEIAEQAGVSTRTLFRYFPNKDDLLVSASRPNFDRLRQEFEAIGPTDDPLGAVWQVFAAQAPWQVRNRDDILLWRRALVDAPEILARVRGETAAATERFLTRICATALEVDPEVDVRPRVLAAAIAAANRAVQEHWFDQGAVGDLDTLFASGLDALRTGLPDTVTGRA